MITVEQALQHIRNINIQRPKIRIKLEEALGHILAEDIYSPIQMPPFNQSAMDGYAIKLHDNTNYKLVGEVKAGDHIQPQLEAGQAIRIFTGAPVPKTADAVIMQEKVAVIDPKHIEITTAIKDQENIRPMGEQIALGDKALPKGTKLNPAAVGFLATLGIEEVVVSQMPKIAILYTGNELVEPGEELAFGQIYNSNAIMLQTALKTLNIQNVGVHHCLDDLKSTRGKVAELIARNEIVIISGGISVGDYDFVKDSLEYNGVEEIFYKVKQKPGKPLFFGCKEDKLIFALPGNPAAALTCFYVYLVPAIQRMTGVEDFELERLFLPLDNDFKLKGDRAMFLKGKRTQTGIKTLDGQSSAMLHTYAISDSLIYLDGKKELYSKGDLVEVINIQ